MDTVTVNASALRQVLSAMVGESYLIRELQATRLPESVFPDNPINVLVREFNEQVLKEQPHDDP
jgi:hypothetical protein